MAAALYQQGLTARDTGTDLGIPTSAPTKWPADTAPLTSICDRCSCTFGHCPLRDRELKSGKSIVNVHTRARSAREAGGQCQSHDVGST